MYSAIKFLVVAGIAAVAIAAPLTVASLHDETASSVSQVACDCCGESCACTVCKCADGICLCDDSETCPCSASLCTEMQEASGSCCVEGGGGCKTAPADAEQCSTEKGCCGGKAEACTGASGCDAGNACSDATQTTKACSATEGCCQDAEKATCSESETCTAGSDCCKEATTDK